MLASIKERIISFIRGLRGVKPLVSHHRDVRLVRRVHKVRVPSREQVKHMTKLMSARERLIIKLSLAVFLVSLAWFGYQVFRSNRVMVPAVGGKYVEAVVGSPQLINPIYASLNDADVDLTKLIFSGLMRYDERQNLEKDLALDYTISDDKKVYTFQLRDDVYWHRESDDANTPREKFTARDVVFTIERIQNEKVNSPLFVSFQGVKVVALDDYTVQFTLQEPFAPFLSSLTVGILPEYIWLDISPDRMHLHKRNLQPIGTGPFAFDKLSKDDTGYVYRYDLKRNEGYYNEPPFIEQFSFQYFSEYEGPNGAIQAMREQRVDGINFVPNDLLEKVERKHIVIHTLQLPQYTSLFFNQDRNEALKNKDLRLALGYALDKNRILRQAIKGEGKNIHGPILPGFPGYDSEVEKLSYSLDQANELLDEKWSRLSAEDYRQRLIEERISTWELSQIEVTNIETTSSTEEEGAVDETTPVEEVDIASLREEEMKKIEEQLDFELNPAQVFYRENDDKEVLTIKLVTAETKEYRQAAELIAGLWQEAGVKTELVFIPPKNISREALKDRNYDVLLYGVIIGSDPDQYPFWHSSQVDFPGLNLSRFINKNADALLESARELDPEDPKFVEAYQKLQDLILSERPAIFLYTPTYTYVTNDRIKNVNVVRIFHPSDRFNNVTKWYVKTKGEWDFGDKEG